MFRKAIIATGFALAAMTSAASATSVIWNPVPGTPGIGDSVTLSGVASGSVTGGSGLDLMLVLDSSGSMGASIDTDGDGTDDSSLAAYQQTAAIALINSLGTSGTSAGVVEFDSNAALLSGLVPINTPANVTALETVISTIDSSGGTDIRDGINAAADELDANKTAGRLHQIVLFSDGDQGGSSAEDAAAAALALGYTVNTVGLPGTDVAKMQAIATSGGGTYIDATTNLTALNSLVAGTGGNFVGVDGLSITAPDGTVYDATTDAFGNFTAAPFTVMAGANTITATATFANGTSQQAHLTIAGVNSSTTVVPLPGGLALYLVGLLGLGLVRRARA